MEIRTRLHTIFMLIGPTECGKTTFVNKVLLPQLAFADEEKGFTANVQYLSSDSIRQELLGSDYDKYEQLMLEASEPAFGLLFHKLRLVTSFPLNAEFVVIDTTGLAEDFRMKVREIADAGNYGLSGHGTVEKNHHEPPEPAAQGSARLAGARALCEGAQGEGEGFHGC
jgi:hypothetical protein